METKSLTSGIDKSHFENLVYKVLFYNLTSDTELLVPELLRITEIGEKQIVITAPANTCAAGHHVELYLFVDESKGTSYTKELLSTFSEVCLLKGRVSNVASIDTMKGKFVSLEISLDNFDPAVIENLVKKFAEREEQLNKILKEANSDE